MNNLVLYNTLTRKLEKIERINDRFTVYFCGPTVYNSAHIGNFRTYLIEDVLTRLLILEGYNPLVVRNITDVDDKTIRDSTQIGITLNELTNKYITLFHNDCKQLNILPPDIEPRATQHINEQIKLIQTLVENGYAYISEGSVYFRVKSFNNYGKLSNISSRKLKTQDTDSSGKKNIADEYDRENICDFVLWKTRKPEDGNNFWNSPWGDGRPGWHIECSAMAMKYLGGTIDLHAGGIDLCFPHHENEIAQSEASTHQQFVRYWFHISHLLVNGTKMSKSLGNMYTLNDILSFGFSPETLRYCLLSGHYRQSLNFTINGLHAADNAIKKLIQFSQRLPVVDENLQLPEHWEFFYDAYNALINDLNIPLCLGNTFKIIKNIYSQKFSEKILKNIAKEFNLIKYTLGLELKTYRNNIPEDIQELACARWEAKLQKNYKLSDEMRIKIESLGWIVNDSKSGFSLKKK